MKISYDLNKPLVKLQISKIQAVIKDTLKVDAGSQASYHIFSVCHFLKNDQELKALLKKDSYSLTANLGTTENPCIIKHELGYFENENLAKYEAEQFIRNCQKQIEWNLLKNGELVTVGSDYTYTIYSKPSPEFGIQLELSISAEKYSDVVEMLEQVTLDIENEFSEKQSGSNSNFYSFNVFGEEFDYIENSNIEDSEFDYVIFDSEKIKKMVNSESEAIEAFSEAHNIFDSWSNVLILAESITLKDALNCDYENDSDEDPIIHALLENGSLVFSGNIHDLLEELKFSKSPYKIYKEINRIY